MSHRIRIITPAIWVKVVQTANLPDRVFPPTFTGLVSFIARKYAIEQTSARAILKDVFRFIRGEVIMNDVEFMVPRFGTFFRRDQAPTRNTALFGEPETYSYLKFRNPKGGGRVEGNLRRSVEDPDDELIEDDVAEVDGE